MSMLSPDSWRRMPTVAAEGEAASGVRVVPAGAAGEASGFFAIVLKSTGAGRVAGATAGVRGGADTTVVFAGRVVGLATTVGGAGEASAFLATLLTSKGAGRVAGASAGVRCGIDRTVVFAGLVAALVTTVGAAVLAGLVAGADGSAALGAGVAAGREVAESLSGLPTTLSPPKDG
jgi:hypothetical protein